MTALSDPVAPEFLIDSAFRDKQSEREEREWITAFAVLVALWLQAINRSFAQEVARLGQIPDAAIANLELRLSVWFQKEAQPLWERVFALGNGIALNEIQRHLGTLIVPDPITSRVWRDTWIQSHTGKLLPRFGDFQVAGLRAVLEYAARSRLKSFSALLRLLRNVVGLTAGQAKVLLAYRDVLRKERIPAQNLDRMVEARAEQLRIVRARRIARTEVQSAYQRGFYFALRQAWGEGKFGDRQIEKVWVTAEDEKVCEAICLPLDGQVTLLPQEFQSSVGPILMPPAHPECRCSAHYRFAPKSTP